MVTYAELQDKVVRCALWLQKQGIKFGDVISMCTGNLLNSIVPCLSAAYINAIFSIRGTRTWTYVSSSAIIIIKCLSTCYIQLD